MGELLRMLCLEDSPNVMIPYISEPLRNALHVGDKHSEEAFSSFLDGYYPWN
jgi:hypothetical protein